MNKITLPNGDIITYIDKLTAIYVYNEIYLDRVYLQNGITLKEGNIVFDIGANIGLFSRFISQEIKNIQVYAFEPVPMIYDCLVENISEFSPNVKAFNFGLAEESGSIDFYFYPKVCADSAAIPVEFERKVDLYVQNYKDSICKDMPIARIVPKFLRRAVVKAGLKSTYKFNKISCQLRTLAEIIEENHIERIDLVKLDAENYEKQVLAGLTDENWNIIQQVAMEVHTHIKGGENLLKEMIELLESKGFTTSIGAESRETIMGVYMLYGKK